MREIDLKVRRYNGINDYYSNSVIFVFCENPKKNFEP